ncbi:MAG: hypothetical protein JNL84_13430 [Candidatus Accumulibacter sp.]|nr:hypothetical protein [Accumulibacter sp.]
MNSGRRQLLRTGLAGALLLSISGWLNAAGGRRLTGVERDMLTAVANALLDDLLPQAAEERRQRLAVTVDGIEQVASGFSLATQRELGELFGLLVLAPGRLMLAGVSRPWRQTTVDEVSEFLQTWRASRLKLLQSAYAALHDLTFAAWYGRPESWQAIAYPGPPRGYF